MELILIVDDDPVICGFVKTLIESETAHRAEFLTDPVEAYARIAAGLTPILVITDQMMAGMDGIGLVKRLRARGYREPIILMSGVVGCESWDVPAVDGIIAKPLKCDRLLTLIDHLLTFAF